MAAPAPSRLRNLAPSATPQSARQRSVLAQLIAAIAPDASDHLAKALLDEFQSLARLFAESPEAVARVTGRDSGVADLIASVGDVMTASMLGQVQNCVVDPKAPELRQYLVASMGSLRQEVLRILFLDCAGRLIADEQIQEGTLRQVELYPRTIFRRALEHGAAGLILVHNHPSGDPAPSAEDIRATQMLDRIGRSLDIAIVDHMIVTDRYVHHIVSADGIGNSTAIYALKSHDRPPERDVDALALANAKATMRRRLLRQQLIGSPELFGEPAWEMLVDLFIHECERKPLSISSLCVTASTSMSTALRLAQKLSDAGILRRIPDPADGRRCYMRLEPATAQKLRAYFAEGED